MLWFVADAEVHCNVWVRVMTSFIVTFLQAILATDVLLLIFIANETKATRLQLLNVGFVKEVLHG